MFELISPNGGGGQAFGVPGARFNMAGPFLVTGIVSIAITGALTNWNPFPIPDTINVIRINPAAGSSIGSIANTIPGRVLYLQNISTTDAFTITHNATGTATNRILCPGDTNLNVPIDAIVQLWYDPVSERWRVTGVSSGGSSSVVTGARVTRSTNQACNTGVTALSFDAEAFDQAGYWVIGSPTRLTVPADGLYLVGASAHINGGGGGADPVISLRLNGLTTFSSVTVGSGKNDVEITSTVLLQLAAADYMEAMIGVSSNTTSLFVNGLPQFWIARLA